MDITKIVSDALKLGVYSNAAVIESNQQGEFHVDFMKLLQTSPSNAEGHVVARVVMNAAAFKSLVAAFEDALEKYEKQAGVVVMPPRVQ